LYILFKKYRESSDPIECQRYKYMFLFTAIGSAGGGSVFFLTFNIPVLPYPLILFSLFPIISIYAIFRFKLFNVRVIATEVLVFSLWMFIFIRILLSVTLIDRLMNVGLFVIMVAAGILLIRSVLKEVHQREQIQKLAEDLEKANQGQSSLIHFMNHQIKGRLGNVKNIFAELLTDDYGVMPEFSKPLLEKGLEESNTGVNYVQNILKGASAENGTLPYDLKLVDFAPILKEVVNKQREFVQKKGLKLEFNIEPGDYHITADSVELGEAIRNLIDNSINYTPVGSIFVRLYDTGKLVRLEVKDTGVGLTPEDKLKLFKAGGRGDESVKVNINSTGYGLVFVKGVIEAHKGKVWAESPGRGKGSTFIIEIPK
jgi:signal transduction histidine kinase